MHECKPLRQGASGGVHRLAGPPRWPGRGTIERTHATDVEPPPSPPRVCMSIHIHTPEGKSLAPISVRVLLLSMALLRGAASQTGVPGLAGAPGCGAAHGGVQRARRLRVFGGAVEAEGSRKAEHGVPRADDRGDAGGERAAGAGGGGGAGRGEGRRRRRRRRSRRRRRRRTRGGGRGEAATGEEPQPLEVAG